MLGVCRGLADYLGLPAWAVRAFAVVLFLTLGWWVLVGYLACGLLLRPALAGEGNGDAAERPVFRAARRLADRAKDLDARLARMESHVTSREFDFDRRLGRS
jgi:phage shock protein C